MHFRSIGLRWLVLCLGLFAAAHAERVTVDVIAQQGAHSGKSAAAPARVCMDLDRDESTSCWDEHSSFLIVDAVESAEQTIAGEEFACALSHSRRVKCWGSLPFYWSTVDDEGTLVRFTSDAPVDVGLENVTQIAGSGDHLCVLFANMHVQCWGRNTYGQLGIGNTHARTLFNSTTRPSLSSLLSFNVTLEPVNIAPAVQIVTGDYHTCVLCVTREVTCWGRNDMGQTGSTVTTDFSSFPTPVSLPPTALLAAGAHFTCAVSLTGDVRCWGANTHGQLGDPLLRAGLHYPQPAAPVPGLTLFLSSSDTNAPPSPSPSSRAISSGSLLAAGFAHACACAPDGSVRCWGNEMPGPHVAVPLPPGAGTVRVSAGKDHACAVQGEGAVVCWGKTDFFDEHASFLTNYPAALALLSHSPSTIADDSITQTQAQAHVQTHTTSTPVALDHRTGAATHACAVTPSTLTLCEVEERAAPQSRDLNESKHPVADTPPPALSQDHWHGADHPKSSVCRKPVTPLSFSALLLGNTTKLSLC
eukprot:m.4858 g.4858  ORF g.4858 m.4858 type:complete len:530 (+) comp4405_c0_seq1:288-1877(+)